MNEQEIFEAAIRLTGEKRLAFVEVACSGDEKLRDGVDALLAAHDESGGFLQEQSPRDLEETFLYEQEAQPGILVGGRYKLVESIGEGGMGTVWLAEQKEPVRRKVAVKLVKAGMDSRSVLARFEAERQALAMMDHPNIAKVLDGGVTELGRPYFAMELVKGIPITAYCDQTQLPVRERLVLFGQVCSAVQHAHQKGIIHRDLKPSNIMVTEHDAKPVVKVIDFGLAKALHGAHTLTGMSMHTSFGSVLGTPLYMAPEQLGTSALDVDTRADLYSLGVILYEMLAGSTPIEREQLKNAAWEEICRLVREEEPPRPSTRLSSSGSLPSLAARRHVEPARLTRLIRGELDCIIMKTLEKDRNRRYESAASLGHDLQRYLDGDPVQAAPPSRLYRLRKVARRYRGTVIAAGLVFLALLVGLAGTMYANAQARQRLTQLEEGNEIITAIFADLNIHEVKQGTEPLEAVLAKRLQTAAKQLEGESIGDPVVVAQMQNRLGQSLISLGYPNEAVDLLTKARETLVAELGGENVDTLASMNDLALAYQNAGKLKLAVSLHKETLELQKAALGADDPDTIRSMSNLGIAYTDAGMVDMAVPLLEEALKRHKAIQGANHEQTLNAMNSLAVAYGGAGKLEQSLRLLEECLQLATQELGDVDLRTQVCMCNLALAYQKAGRGDLAVPLLEKTLRLQERLLSADHPHKLKTMSNLADAYNWTGKTDQAIRIMENILTLSEARFGPLNVNTLTYTCNLAVLYSETEKVAEAQVLLEQALPRLESQLPRDHPLTLSAMQNLGMAYKTAGKLNEALPLLEEAVKRMTAESGRDHPDTLLMMKNLASVYMDAMKYDLAIPLYNETLHVMGTRFGGADFRTISVINDLVTACEAAGKPDLALPLTSEWLANGRDKYPSESPELASMLAFAGLTYLKAKAFAEAEPICLECLEIRKKAQPDSWVTFGTQSMLGGALLGQKKYADAESLLLKGCRGMMEREATMTGLAKSRLTEAIQRLIDLYEARGMNQEVAVWEAELAKRQSDQNVGVAENHDKAKERDPRTSGAAETHEE